MSDILGIPDPFSTNLQPNSCGSCKSDTSCDKQPLLKENYLSEFVTESEKEKARKNLGLNSTVDWGNIGGYIENQTDLIKFIENNRSEIIKIIEDNNTNYDQSIKEIVESLNKYIKKEADGDIAVEQIRYDNPAYDNIFTLKDALDKLLYVDLTLTVSVSPSVVRLGEYPNKHTVEIQWYYNKQNIVKQEFNGEVVDTMLRSMTIGDSSLKTTTSWYISGNDGTQTVKKEATIYFYPAIVYGVTTDKATGNNPTRLKTLLQSNRRCTINVIAGIGEYIYIELPKSYGTPTFTVGGFSGGFAKIKSYTYTGESGETTDYDVYVSDNANLGNTTINIT